jgi:cytochrome c biogenesis factor
MTDKSTGKKLLYLILSLFLFTLAFLLVFSLAQRVWVGYPVFYKGIIVCFITLLVSIVVVLILLKRNQNRDNFLVLLICSCFIAMSFITTIPVMLDRSVSISMVGIFDAYPQGITRAEMEKEVLRVHDIHQMINRRLKEQLLSGFIVEEGREGKFKLTGRGRMVSVFAIFIAEVFAIPKDGETVRLPYGAALPERF